MTLKRTYSTFAGAVQRAAGPGGQAKLGEAATRRRQRRLLQVERVLVRRWHGCRCCEGGQLGERHGTPNAGRRPRGRRAAPPRRRRTQSGASQRPEMGMLKDDYQWLLIVFSAFAWGYSCNSF